MKGKIPCPFVVIICFETVFLQNNGTHNQFIFAHAFLCLEWNLMYHVDNLVLLNVNFIRWEDNLFLYNLSKAKHDHQEGEGAKTS